MHLNLDEMRRYNEAVSCDKLLKLGYFSFSNNHCNKNTFNKWRSAFPREINLRSRNS